MNPCHDDYWCQGSYASMTRTVIQSTQRLKTVSPIKQLPIHSICVLEEDVESTQSLFFDLRRMTMKRKRQIFFYIIIHLAADVVDNWVQAHSEVGFQSALKWALTFQDIGKEIYENFRKIRSSSISITP